MNLEKAFKIVLKKAESSALNERVSRKSKKTLKAIQALTSFYQEYGYFFAEYNQARQEKLQDDLEIETKE
tara:strand:+ start:1633 stop:1842 length:210 start_codon:yes stop_codon:yes gene_type:complete